MSPTHPPPEPLIEALISGLGEDPLWSSFLDLLRTDLRADYASIVFRPLGRRARHRRVVHLFSGAASPPLVSELYRERLYLEDPLPYGSLEPGRPYSLSGLLNDADPRHRAYRRQFLAPSSMNHLRMMRVEEAGGVSAWLIASRRLSDFGGRDDKLFATLAPYLRAALSAHLAHERERTQGAVAAEAMRRMNFGWLTLDASSRILDADDTAETILAGPHAHLSRDRSGRLQARELDVRRAIAQILANGSTSSPRPRVVVLSREPWVDMLILPVVVRPNSARGTPVAFVYIHVDQWTTEDHYDHMHALFGLTPREACLALNLSRGKSIAEAAKEMNVSVGSARTYTKRIYSKTGARGQNDLIRFVHRSVMMMT